jgi:hypothetical protein
MKAGRMLLVLYMTYHAREDSPAGISRRNKSRPVCISLASFLAGKPLFSVHHMEWNSILEYFGPDSATIPSELSRISVKRFGLTRVIEVISLRSSHTRHYFESPHFASSQESGIAEHRQFSEFGRKVTENINVPRPLVP